MKIEQNIYAENIWKLTKIYSANIKEIKTKDITKYYGSSIAIVCADLRECMSSTNKGLG